MNTNEKEKQYITLEKYCNEFKTKFEETKLNEQFYYIKCDLIKISPYKYTDKKNNLIKMYYLELYEKSKNDIFKVVAKIYENKLDKDFDIDSLKGKKVLVKAHPYFALKTHTLGLDIETIEEFGISKEKKEYERVYNHYKKIGAFLDTNKPRLPKKGTVKTIAIITKKNSDAYYDIKKSIILNDPFINILEYDCSVQGEKAPASIKEMIEKCNNDNKAEVIILGRGGGSDFDLKAYNDELVVDAIYKSKIPIITSIGHTSDQFISDYVSSFSAVVPAKAIDAVLNPFEHTKSNYNTILYNINSNYKKLILRKTNILEKISSNIKGLSPEAKTLQKKNKLNNLENNLNNIFNKKINKYENKLFIYKRYINDYDLDKKLLSKNIKLNNINENIEKCINYKLLNYNNILKLYSEKLQLLDFNKIIKRGFSLIYKDDLLVTNINDVKKDDIIDIKLKNGNLKAKVL